MARELGSLMLPLPPLSEQRRFVDKLNELRFIQLRQSQSTTKTEQLQEEIDNLYLEEFGMTQTELKKSIKGQH